MKQKDPLFRRVNSKAIGCHHKSTPDASSDRGTKKGMSKKMKHGTKHGLDYTPLFKFLLSKVGQDWDSVYSEIFGRVQSVDPIGWMVKSNPNYESIWRAGESSYYSTLFIDDSRILRKINPEVKLEDLYPSCPCCTHTFNGKPFIKKYEYGKYLTGTPSKL